ncbi:MAG: hypothetical protein RJB62_275 [Pseudomonadota bacterium]|jgi:predicted aspartyl protease
MRISFSFVAAFVFGMAGGLYPAMALERCTAQEMLELELFYDSVGRPIVPVSLDGRERYFLIDTGGAISTIDRGPAEAWGLDFEEAGTWLMDVTGARSDQMVVIGEFLIGPLRSEEHALILSPGLPGEDSEKHFIGTISPDILQAYDVEFDFGRGFFHLYEPGHCAGNVVHWPHERLTVIPFEMNHAGHIAFPVTLDGIEMTAIVDTGAQYSTLNRDIAEADLGMDFSDETLEAVGTIGEENDLVYRHTFEQLTLNGLEINEPVMTILPDLIVSDTDQLMGLRSGLRLPDLIIGMSVLSRLHLYIAYDEKRLYVTEAGPGE